MKPINSHILVFLLLVSSMGFAQMETDSFTIVKAFKPALSHAPKIKSYPQISDTVEKSVDLNYQFLDKRLSIDFDPEPIQAAKIKGEPLVKLYKGYAKLGMGTNVTPMADIYFNKLRSKKSSYGARFRHFSSQGIADIENSDFRNDRLQLYGKRFWKHQTLHLEGSFQNDMYNYFGFGNVAGDETIEDVSKNEDVRQIFNKLSLSATLFNDGTKDTTGIWHKTGIRFYHRSDDYDASENNVLIHSHIKHYAYEKSWNVNLSVDYNNFSSSPSDSTTLFGISSNNTIIGAHPQLLTGGDIWDFKIGLGVYMEMENDVEFNIYPSAELKVNLIENILIPYLGIHGQVERNSMDAMVTENPFVDTYLNLLNTKFYRGYAGLRGSLSSKVSFNASVGAGRWTDAVLFVKDPHSINQRKFMPVYDDLEVLELKGDLMYQLQEKLKFGLMGEYYSYKTETELEAWHKPDYRVTATTWYDLRDKIVTNLDVFVIGKQFARNYIPTSTAQTDFDIIAQELDGTVDINLGFEYRYTKKLSLFLDFNNIASIEYEKWKDYPVRSFNILGGLKFTF